MKKLAVFLVVLAVVFSFAAQLPYIGADANGKPGGQFVLGTLSGPKTVNDVTAKETSSTDVIEMFMSYGGTLIERHGVDMKFYPAIAESWEGPRLTADGGMEVIWHIRKGVKFSDGQPLTADDIVFTLNEIYTNPDIPSSMQDVLKSTHGYLPKAEKIDDYTVRMYYPEPFRLAFRYLGGMYIFPKHIAEEYVKNGNFQEFWTVDSINKGEVVGLGPYIPVEYVPDQYIKFVKNPYYWKKDANGNPLPYFDEVIYKIISNQDAMRLAFENGEIDVYGPRGTEFAELKEKEKELNIVVTTAGPAFGTLFITFNWNTPDPIKRKWFRNEYFRKAVAYAIDKESIIDTLYNGLAIPQWSPVSMSSPYYNEDVVTKYEFDLDLARAMLEMGGFTWDENGQLIDEDGNPVKFLLTTNAGNRVREGAANIIQDALKKLGMDVTFTPIDFNTLVQKLLNTGDWESIIIGLTGGDEPQSGANVWKVDAGLHFWNYSPDTAEYVDKNDYYLPDWELEIDKIFKENVAILDENIVKDYFARFQQLVSEHLPLIYTVNQLRMYAYRANLRNVKIGPLGGTTWNIYEEWREQ
ncbi:ABC transporter substrate-binding protein [Thermosipho sp. 1074]|uniref:ABC transporter substrate-binding protein n=1 Tax=Thermosipho sp. 1074 TaxID=1643331 RepID=UPI0009867361|nr:ABC transporter substrate-binding protein [Thermosipho sp. 1074]OOC42127.1 peptide ABC transporter substrate-binding protein [Thermosipho sp. 1074]